MANQLIEMHDINKLQYIQMKTIVKRHKNLQKIFLQSLTNEKSSTS